MKIKVRALSRIGYVVSALALSLAVIYPALMPGVANAAQLASRSITLSDSGASGGTITSGVGSGAGVTYRVGFTTSVSASSLIIDFCSNDPIVGDSCTAPTGMVDSSATLSGVTGNINAAGWNITTPTSSQVKLALGSGTAASAGSQVFDLVGITNPSTTGSFYARVYTYGDNSFGSTTTAYTGATTPGDYKDYGGIALSTNQIITITARVQETLSFCVSGTSTSLWTTKHDCTDSAAAVAPALTLGHGAPTAILDSSAVDTGAVYSQLSTNATNGAVISMRNNNTTCGGLSADGGTTCAIPAVGATNAVIAPGTADFGMNCSPGVADAAGGTGSDTCSSTYYNASHTNAADVSILPAASDAMWFGMDTSSAVGSNVTYPNQGNVKTTFGSVVATTTAPCYRVDNAYTFGATAALTTPAGIYTANLDLVATGTF
jgi:hypothetical protein